MLWSRPACFDFLLSAGRGSSSSFLPTLWCSEAGKRIDLEPSVVGHKEWSQLWMSASVPSVVGGPNYEYSWLLLLSFSLIFFLNHIWFYLGNLGCLPSGSWPSRHYQALISLHGVGIKVDHLGSHSHKFCATTVVLYKIERTGICLLEGGMLRWKGVSLRAMPRHPFPLRYQSYDDGYNVE